MGRERTWDDKGAEMNEVARPVPREVTQAKLDRRNAASGWHRASRPYTLADRLEERVQTYGSRVFLTEGSQHHTYQPANQRINQVLVDPEFVARARAIGMEPRGGTPEQLTAFIREEAQRWVPMLESLKLPRDTFK